MKGKTKSVLIILLGLALLGMGIFYSIFTRVTPHYNLGSDAMFVQKVALAIAQGTDTADLFRTGGDFLYDLTGKPSFQPCFYISWLKTDADKEDPSLIRYSCLIPGPSRCCYDMALSSDLTYAEIYSPWIKAEGEVRVVRDENGARRIDLGDGSNVFALYATLRYMNPALLSAAGINGKLNKTNYADAMQVMLNVAAEAYGRVLGVSSTTFANETIIPELKAMQDNTEKWAAGQPAKQIGYTLAFARSGGIKGLCIVCLLGLLCYLGGPVLIVIGRKQDHVGRVWNKSNSQSKKVEQVSKISYKRERKELVRIALQHENSHVREAAMKTLARNHDTETLRQILLQDESSSRYIAWQGLSWAKDADIIKEIALAGHYDAMRHIPDGEAFHRVLAEKLLSKQPRTENTVLIIKEAINIMPYRPNRQFLLDLAQHEQNDIIRDSAVGKLEYPDDREALIGIARADTYRYCRRSALDKLPLQQESEAISGILLHEEEYYVASDVLEKLRYPEDEALLLALTKSEYAAIADEARKKLPHTHETIIAIALRGRYADERREALEQLTYPEDRDAIAKVCLTDEDDNNRLFALQKLKYAKDRETIIQAAVADGSEKVALPALKELKYAKDREAIGKAAAENPSLNVRAEALKRLRYPEDHEAFAYAALHEEDQDLRRRMLEKLTYPLDRETLIGVAMQPIEYVSELIGYVSTNYDKTALLRHLAISKIPFLGEAETYATLLEKGLLQTDEDRTRAVIALLFDPVSKGILPVKESEILRRLCRWTQDGLKGDETAVTLAGWSAAALGRILAQQMKPDKIESNQKQFSLAADRWNKIQQEILSLQEQLRPYIGKKPDQLKSSERDFVETILSRQHELISELEPGLGCFMVDNGDLPLAYLVHLLRDQQTRVPRFIRQGIIMGLVDWLGKNSAHPDAKKLLDTVIAVRADMIRSDNEFSFFEVRAPRDHCTEEEYAALLDEVLHCANPSLPFCKAKELLQNALKEVPGSMDMLRACPLRLIDPANRKSLGFYKFRPFAHIMWVQYTPPKDTGEVIKRFHEVDDRTRPLSSGLNLQLFLNPWSVIPTLFHEYQHFAGDPNEASVFLKTQLFSIAFYKKYPQANPAQDGVFARLTEELGMPPQLGKRGALNALIERYYGKQVSKAVAENQAKNEIDQLNEMVKMVNAKETWDPKVKFPLLADDEDAENRDLIRDIVIRYATVPKSITEKQFSKILSGFGVNSKPEEEEEDEGHRPD